MRLAVSPDGRTLATTSRDGIAHLWNLSTGKERRRIEKAGSCMAFAPDGRSLATGDGFGVIHLWELATGLERRRLPGHERDPDGQSGFGSGVTALAFSPDGKSLISGGGDTTVLIWDIRTPNGERRAAEAIWADLAHADAVAAYDAMCNLAASPSETVRFLGSRLTAAVAPDPQRTARLIADLDNEQFAVRDRASAALAKLGEAVVPLLRDALARDPTPEVSRRLKALLEKAANQEASGDLLRDIRAIEVLEHIATPEARELLKKLAGGAPEARLTREAKAALERLGQH
jgi:hypothetical protein